MKTSTPKVNSSGKVVKSILKNGSSKFQKYPVSVMKISDMIKEARKVCESEGRRTGEECDPVDDEGALRAVSPPGTPMPPSPTSPSIANGQHSCGSVFVKCSEFGRSPLLQTFTDTNSSLFRGTFQSKPNASPCYKSPLLKSNTLDVPSNKTGCTSGGDPDPEMSTPVRRHNSLPENRIQVEEFPGDSTDKIPVSLFEILKEQPRERSLRSRSSSESNIGPAPRKFWKAKKSATPVLEFYHPEIPTDHIKKLKNGGDEDELGEEDSLSKSSTERVVNELLNGRSYSEGTYPPNNEDIIEYLQSLVQRLKKDARDWEQKADTMETEWLLLRREMKKKDEENLKLRTENHKLKSVLLQKNVAEQKDLLSSLQDSHSMAGQVQMVAAAAAPSKKQGVSGESSDHGRTPDQIQIQRYDKDFRSRQLIKDAVMDNDFLENLDASQIRELVDCVFLKEFPQDSYVLREGEAGSHLYVSAEGELEVIKEDKVLGRMGPGKAFGELAILYNCRRTASIKVVSECAKVWALDRRVFQQIMMRAVKQRLEEKINFVKSVPLLHKLSHALVTKIADVLDLEFYPSGAHIIHQGAVGDTFFIISEGQVKVTQRTAGRREEEEIRILGKGDYFGEQALLKDEHRTASVIALSPGVECLTLARDSFIDLIGDLSELHDKNYGDETRGLPHTASTASLVDEEEYDYIRLDDLDVIATLGVGGFGRVELVQYVYDRSLTFALKCLKKQHIVDTHQQGHVQSEKKIMMSCNSPFICRLYRTFRDTKYVYMMLEACLGGEVWTILRDKSYFDDNTTKFVTACVVEAFEYLHARGIIYRDLKPENLLLDNHGYVKIVDMGFSKTIGFSHKTWTFCGTPEYVAPEVVLNKGHDRAVDCWALGVLMHELLTGKPPFTAPDPMKTYILILKGFDVIKFPKHVTRTAQSLIKHLCRDSPAERLGYQKGGLQDVKSHKWFHGFDWEGLKHRTLTAPIVPRVSGPTDYSNFDSYPKVVDIAPDELSDWDVNF